MKKNYLFFIATIFVLTSCSGILWNSDESDELTITINNPFYRGSSASQVSNSRALALQGDYLYIELALINDQAAYNIDTNIALTGNGSWVSTAWGGHAIISFNLNTWTATLEAVFSEVPRGKDLKARVLLDYDQVALEFGIAPQSRDYEVETNPISSTYDVDAPDMFSPTGQGAGMLDQSWVTVSFVDLSSNVISLPLRPFDLTATLNIPGFGSNFIGSPFNEIVPEDYLFFSTNDTDPSPGQTRFTSFQIDLSATNLTDLAIFAVKETSFSNSPPNPGIINLYNKDGSLVTNTGGNANRSFYLAFPEIDATYINSDIFIGSTIFDSIDLTSAPYSGGTYNVTYGVLHDTSATFDTGNDYMRWSLPPGLLPGDLQFKLLLLEGYNLLADNEWESISQINAMNPTTMVDWSSNPAPYGTYYDLDTSTWPYIAFTDESVVILARVPGGKEFIYARAYYSGA